jgi:3-hydroxyacyl-CoA dehydrogenase
MANSKQIHNVAIVGTGVIGASWAGYLTRGLNITATDPAPDVEANLRRYIDAAGKDLTVIGLSKNASRDHLKLSRLMPNQSTVLGHAHKESIRS